jgi:enoyl-CoA hydratase
MSYEQIRYEIQDGVAVVTVDRPDALNALSVQVFDELDRAFTEAGANDAVRAAVLTGAGDKAFVAGADIKAMSSMGPVEARAYSDKGQSVMLGIERLGKPVVAAVNGFALGGGCELAMCCHVRFASEKAKFGQPEVNLGLIPGFAGSQRLPRIVGQGKALELLLSGDMIRADEALRIGLVNRVLPAESLMEESLAFARTLAGKAPIAIRLLLDVVLQGAGTNLEEGSGLEQSLFGLNFSTEDAREGMKAFLEKREADFKGV